MTKDLFVIHHSVFHDAFRTDYDIPFKQSSKDFFQLLFNHYREKGTKIAITSGEVFDMLLKSSLSKSDVIWVIPDKLVDIDYKTFVDDERIKLEQSIVKLAARKSIKKIPYIVATKQKDRIILDGSLFPILTPKEAIDLYTNKNSNFG